MKIGTGHKLRAESQPGGCRPLIYNNVVSRYFSKMLFAKKPERFALLLSLVYSKKVTEISSKAV